MSEAKTVLLWVSCPGCKTQHDFEVKRDYLKHAIEQGGDVELYCLASDARWPMSPTEWSNVKKRLADGTL